MSITYIECIQTGVIYEKDAGLTHDYANDPDFNEHQSSVKLVKPSVVNGALVESATTQEVADHLASYKAEKIADIKVLEKGYRDQLMGEVDGHTAMEYVAVLMEAMGELAEIDVPTIKGEKQKILTKMAEVFSDVATEAAVVKTVWETQAGLWYGESRGYRRKANTAILAATDVAGVDVAYNQYVTDMDAFIAAQGV